MFWLVEPNHEDMALLLCPALHYWHCSPSPVVLGQSVIWGRIKLYRRSAVYQGSAFLHHAPVSSFCLSWIIRCWLCLDSSQVKLYNVRESSLLSSVQTSESNNTILFLCSMWQHTVRTNYKWQNKKTNTIHPSIHHLYRVGLGLQTTVHTHIPTYRQSLYLSYVFILWKDAGVPRETHAGGGRTWKLLQNP